MFDDLAKGFKPQETESHDAIESTEPAEMPNERVQVNENFNNTVPEEPLIVQNPTNPLPKQNDNPPEPEQGPIAPYIANLDEDPLADDNFLQMIEDIEKNNQGLVHNAPNQPNHNVVLNQNVQNVQNVNQRNNHFVPPMYFPHSTVTINYNFAK